MSLRISRLLSYGCEGFVERRLFRHTPGAIALQQNWWILVS
ncbi:hypothetical protein [Nostoc sp. PCC 7107]|nr:hypothetical protein [Nostoc sp. PCC 7107]